MKYEIIIEQAADGWSHHSSLYRQYQNPHEDDAAISFTSSSPHNFQWPPIRRSKKSTSSCSSCSTGRCAGASWTIGFLACCFPEIRQTQAASKRWRRVLRRYMSSIHLYRLSSILWYWLSSIFWHWFEHPLTFSCYYYFLRRWCVYRLRYLPLDGSGIVIILNHPSCMRNEFCKN